METLSKFISAEVIAARVKEMGEQITAEFKGEKLLMIGVLKGSFIFMADLARAIDLKLDVDFMMVSSFDGIVSTGAVRIVSDLSISVENRDVLIVEDILDSGRTLEYIKTILEGRNPKSIRLCTLLDKPSRRLADISADYVGFEVPDEFVVGYGLDYNEAYRNLKYIGVLKPEVYTDKDAAFIV